MAAAVAATSHAAVVSGRVSDTAGKPVAKVGVTDGRNIVYTAADGSYRLDTDKSVGLVYVITPNGYEPAKWLVNRPKFWQQLTAPAQYDEQADFVLRPVDDSRTAFVTLADIQMGGINDDIVYYNRNSVPDINATLDSLRQAGRTPFVITLGDESWDRYWNETGVALPELISKMEKIDAPFYNVIGNHDHDPHIEGDEHSSDTWRRLVGPNYYAFNRGGVHFVMLDDINYQNDGGAPGHEGKRNYTGEVSQQQLDWLRQDLQTVAKTTPVVISVHIPVLKAGGKFNIKGGEQLAELLKDYANVRILSGHTHLSYAAQNGNLRENNYGAVCGTWWRTDAPDYGNIGLCVDGTPSGYSVWTVDGGQPAGRYKSVGHGLEYQFRAYDGNRLPEVEKNAIIVNVWGWEPGWSIEITEKGKQLPVEQTKRTDPLHKQVCEVPQLRDGKKPTQAHPTNHIFVAKTRKSTTPVTIKVTDHTGRVYTQTLNRN